MLKHCLKYLVNRSSSALWRWNCEWHVLSLWHCPYIHGIYSLGKQLQCTELCGQLGPRMAVLWENEWGTCFPRQSIWWLWGIASWKQRFLWPRELCSSVQVPTGSCWVVASYWGGILGYHTMFRNWDWREEVGHWGMGESLKASCPCLLPVSLMLHPALQWVREAGSATFCHHDGLPHYEPEEFFLPL